MNALKEEQGRPINMSLFDEIRLSLCSPRRGANHNENACDKCLDNLEHSCYTIGTQTDEGFNENDGSKCDCEESPLDATDTSVIDLETQTDVDKVTLGTQTEDHTYGVTQLLNKVNIETQTNTESTKCLECEKLKNYTTKLENDLNKCQSTVNDLEHELDTYENNLELLDNFLDEGSDRNNYLQTVVQSLQSKLGILEVAVTEQKNRLDDLNSDTYSAECQTESGNLYYVL